jgi:hypothetical protein
VVAGLLGRKADAFAALLDGTSKTPQDPALAHLAQLTQRLSSVPQPSAAFKSALRQQLVHAAAHPAAAASAVSTAPGALHTVPRPRLSPGHGTGAGGAAGSGASGTSSAIMGLGKSAPLWIKLFTGITAAAVSATGVGVGAHRALPGDPFYGIKKQVEAVQLDLASGAREKATTQLGFAHARINELKELIKRDHITPTSNLSSATAGHVRGLLQAWAEDAGVATTSLIEQIRALGSKTSTAKLSAELRQTLAGFTSASFGQIGALLADVPTGPLQSLTVSALGYLQRVDGVLGGNPATLIQQLPIPLSSIPNLAAVIPQLNLPAGLGSTGSLPTITSILPGGKGGVQIPNPLPSGIASPKVKLPRVLPSLAFPTAIPTVTIPKTGAGGISLPSTGNGILPTDGGLTGVLKNPTGGSGGSGVGGAVTGVGGAISSAGGTISGTTGKVGGAVSSAGGTVGNVGGVISSAGGTVGGVISSAGGTVAGVTGGTGNTGGVGSTVSGATGGAVGGVSSTVGTVTGGLSSSSGPALPLPTSLPTLPPLPKLTGLLP